MGLEGMMINEVLANGLNLVARFGQRIESAQYALACDDEANAHYKIKPCRWHRVKLVIKALFS